MKNVSMEIVEQPVETESGQQIPYYGLRVMRDGRTEWFPEVTDDRASLAALVDAFAADPEPPSEADLEILLEELISELPNPM